MTILTKKNKVMKKFYRNLFIFHLIFYPLITWIYVMGKSDTKNATGAIIVIFGLGFTVSIWTTSIRPWIRLKKKEKKLETKKVINNDYIN
jgi:hypothetical protein